jgi:hypothetical protein
VEALAFHRDETRLDIPVVRELLPAHLGVDAHHEVGSIGGSAGGAAGMLPTPLEASPPSMQASLEPVVEQPMARRGSGRGLRLHPGGDDGGQVQSGIAVQQQLIVHNLVRDVRIGLGRREPVPRYLDRLLDEDRIDGQVRPGGFPVVPRRRQRHALNVSLSGVRRILGSRSTNRE